MSRSRICLNMIVKDESANIEETLKAVVGEIDYYVICDTGSSDNTVELIGSVMERNGIRGEIHNIEFNNFEYAFNAALTKANESGGEFDYILRVDADNTLEVQDAGWKEKLGRDVYSIETYNQTTSYYKPMMVKKGFPAKYVGLTHEKLVFEGRAEKTGMIRFLDRATGHSRENKYQRDVMLLKQALQDNPKDSRSYFYLAQSLLKLGQYEKAIAVYTKRISMGGWNEEVFYSAYKIGIALEKLEKWKGAMESYRAAFEMRPHRIEPLYRISLCWRKLKKYNLALLYSRQAMREKSPGDDILFIGRDIYHYKMQLLHIRNLLDCERYREASEQVGEMRAIPDLPDSVQNALVKLKEKIVIVEKRTQFVELEPVDGEAFLKQLQEQLGDFRYSGNWTLKALSELNEKIKGWISGRMSEAIIRDVRLYDHVHDWKRSRDGKIRGLTLGRHKKAADVALSFQQFAKLNHGGECHDKIMNVKKAIDAGEPMPPLYLQELETGDYLCVDGLHRVLAYNLLLQEGRTFALPKVFIATDNPGLFKI